MAELEKVQPRKFKYLLEESYIAMIKNSIGTKMFRNYFVKNEQGKKQDILNNGDLSCPIFVGHVLKNFNLIDTLHFTVTRTVEDIERNSWKKVNFDKLQPGDVLVWSASKGRTGFHTHIGFYIGNKKAVSNSSKRRAIGKHHFTYSGQRVITGAYRPDWSKFK